MKVNISELPVSIKQEIEKLEMTLAPRIKKVSQYTLWSVPLIMISIVNLFISLVVITEEERRLVSIIVYAIMGALGFALYREANLQQKLIQRMSCEYIVARIKNSERAPDPVKQRYIRFVKARPFKSINYFIKFLIEENSSPQ